MSENPIQFEIKFLTSTTGNKRGDIVKITFVDYLGNYYYKDMFGFISYVHDNEEGIIWEKYSGNPPCE